MAIQKLNKNKTIHFFNSDIMPLDTRSKSEYDKADFNSINKDTMLLDTPVKPEYDKREEPSSSCIDHNTPFLSPSGLTRGSRKQECRFSQSGRSMVEMLGTLAIIGVLSIGGIMGYSYGMDKYRANETINDINLRRVVLSSQVFPNYSLSEFPSHSKVGYLIEAPSFYAGGFIITIHGLPLFVCEKVYEHFFSSAENIFLYKDNQQISFCQEKNSIKFFFNHHGGITDYMCGNKYCQDNQQCYQGQCIDAVCTIQKECKNEANPFCRLFPDPKLNECVPLCKLPTTTIGNCPCNTDEDCLDEWGKPKTADARYCDFGAKRCSRCIKDEDCGENQVCDMNNCLDIVCRTDALSMNERVCSTCENFEWNGHACCPTLKNEIYPFTSLASDECVACGGMIQNDMCVMQECQSDLSVYTALSTCQRCGGLWENDKQICVTRECTINSDCPSGYYCGAQSHSNCYPVYNKCHALDIKEFTIVHNNQKEIWYYPENAYNYWSLERACEAIGKSVPDIEELKQRWRSIYSVLGITTTLSSSTPNGSCSKFSISPMGNIYGTYHNTQGICH